jgi:Zn finger protein HypA/HybF involved in hydrogenase expression
VQPNRLLCASCGDFRTRIISGDELILQRVELGNVARNSSPAAATN